MEETETGVPAVKHDVLVSVRLDYDTLRELDRIALFEHEKRATLARRFIIEKVQTYLRNPAYKRFLKQLEEKALRERERELRKAEEKKWEG
jgi:predicted transcriptional regulator